MKKLPDSGSNHLREKAEKLLKNKSAGKTLVLSETDTLRLIHELEVHRIELEMQNDELANANKAAQDALDLYDFAPVGYYSLSSDGEIIRLNFIGAAMFGKERSNLIKKNFTTFISTNTKPIFNLFLEKIFGSYVKESCEITLSIPNKPLTYLHISGIRTKNLQHCLITAVDITDTKQAEIEIRLAHARAKSFINSDIVGIIIADSDGKVIETNDYYLNIIGYSRSDFEAGLVDWRKITPPEWLYADEKAIDELRETGKCTPYEKEYIRRDGSRCFVLITDATLPGSEMHIAGFIVDITERKMAELALQESELKYRELIENSPDAVAIYVDGKIAFANKECARLMRVDNPEKFIGIPVMEFVHPDSRMIVAERMNLVSGTNVVLPLMEEKFIRPDGTDVLVEVKAMSLKFENKHAVQLIIRDITKRKQAEEELKNSEAKFRYLFESNDDGIVIFPVIGEETPVKMIDLNENAAKMLGYTKAEMLELSIDQIEKVRDTQKTEARKIELLSKGISIFETTILHKDGHDVEVELKNILINYNNQRALMYIVRDITNRKKAEKALRESEERNKALLEANPDLMFMLDKNEVFVDFHSSSQLPFYATSEYIIGKNVREVLPPEVAELTCSKLKEVLQSGQMQIFSYQLMINDRPRDFESRLVSCGNLKALSIVRDITEREHAQHELKESELKFRELFEVNSDGITIFNVSPDGPSNILDMNENAAKMVGYSKDEMKAFSPNDFEKDVTQAKMEKRMHELISKGYSNFETIIKHKDGHEIDVEIKVMMVNYNNQPALMNIVRDITDRKNSEIQLQKYAIELSKQIAEKDKFFSIIAHDLRGPFNGFLELTELMASGSSGMSMQDIQKIAGVMKKSATNLFRLLGNLLEWSRMQRGITTYDPGPIILNSKIHEITGLAEEAASKKGISVNYTIPADLVVFADENMLEGILRNLVTNAVKYSNTGGSITVSAKYVPGDTVEFSIKDNGIGMSTAILDNLFNVDVNTSRKGTAGELSTGLGLMICKDFIEKHHGVLRIESEVGKGSTFFFTIPGRIESSYAKTSSEAATDNPSDQARKLNILIAEDEETSDLLISIALTKISRETYHAKTGLEAIDICRAYPHIDLIMMDIKMPEMDGYEATRQIRLFNKNVIIIAQTAFTYSHDREKSVEAGCNDYIAKPISQAELMEIIQKYFK